MFPEEEKKQDTKNKNYSIFGKMLVVDAIKDRRQKKMFTPHMIPHTKMAKPTLPFKINKNEGQNSDT